MMRHGSRTVYKPMACWAAAPGAPAVGPDFQGCDSLPLAVGVSRSPRLIKHYDSRGGCSFGSLLPVANSQFMDNAKSLNASYGSTPWWHTLDPSDPASVFLYSCDNDRNLGSLDMVINHLFPEHQSNGSMFVHTTPAAEDPWKIDVPEGPPCAGAKPPTVDTVKEIAEDPAFHDFVRRWNQASNSTWAMDYFDCIITAQCSGAPIPSAISTELAKEAVNWGFREKIARVRSTDWTSLLSARAWAELASKLGDAVNGKGPSLAIWSNHDTTMIYMLQALGAWNGLWPRYASMISVELYRKEGKHMVRVVQDGTVLPLEACDGRSVCPFEEFTSIIASWLSSFELCKKAGDVVLPPGPKPRDLVP